MITEKDLLEAIATCQGVPNPNASTCIKLAAYYTILDHIYDEDEETYSLASHPSTTGTNVVEYDSGTDFSNLIHGRTPESVWPVIDEAMTVIQMAYPRIFRGVADKLKQ